ncbi:MAG: hypothetical protein ABIH21_03925, partial [Patescibacteria group bacterium]
NESDPSEPCLIDPKGNQRSTCTWLHGEFVHMLYRRFFQQSNGARTKGKEDDNDAYTFWAEVRMRDGQTDVLVHRTQGVETSYNDRVKRDNDLAPADTEAFEWINKEFPDWQDPLAYWDETPTIRTV